jgi:hypothetical protein
LKKNKINLFDKINKEDNYTLIGGFSNSWPPFLARKEKLFQLASKMKEHKINLNSLLSSMVVTFEKSML